jgi:hypothetical protein
MCHEASGRALTAALGTGKGTVDLTDWEKTECLIVMGVNAASNTPRMLTSLAEAYRHGAQVVHVNPLIEAASTRTIVPHEILSMATFHATRIGRLKPYTRTELTWIPFRQFFLSLRRLRTRGMNLRRHVEQNGKCC